VLRLLDVLADPAVTHESAVIVAVSLLRQLADSPFGHVAVAQVTMLSLDRIAAGRDLRTVIRLFTTHVKSALNLRPQDRDLVLQRVRVYVESKNMAR
jgi:hypothetical protein